MTLPQESTTPRFGLARDGYKYVVTVGEDGLREKLVPLGRDDENLAESHEEMRRAMRGELSALRDKFPAGEERVKRALSNEDRERLRALGYVAE